MLLLKKCVQLQDVFIYSDENALKFDRMQRNKADPEQTHRVHPPPHLKLINCFWFFVNFNFYSLCSKNAMFTIFLFSPLTTKTQGIYVNGHQNNHQTPIILPRRDPPPPGLKIHGFAAVIGSKENNVNVHEGGGGV